MIHKFFRNLENRILRTYQFISDWLYYIERGYGLRMAWRMAHDTIKGGRW